MGEEVEEAGAVVEDSEVEEVVVVEGVDVAEVEEEEVAVEDSGILAEAEEGGVDNNCNIVVKYIVLFLYKPTLGNS